jgi:hypothetical protein
MCLRGLAARAQQEHAGLSRSQRICQNERHETTGPICEQVVVTGAGRLSSDAPRLSISIPLFVPPPLFAQALRNMKEATRVVIVTMRIMQASVGFGDRAE